MIFLLCGCQSKSTDNQSSQSIDDRINEDLGTPPSSTFVPDTTGMVLPKTLYQSDADHSSISFKTGHWEIVDLIGWFDDFDVQMYSDKADFSDAVIFARLGPSSIQMPNIKMAQTASKFPYMDSEKYGDLTFVSTQMIPSAKDQFTLTGILSLNGIQREMDFAVTFNGFAYPGEKPICGFSVNGSINRSEFNIAGDDRLHSGRLVHNEEIHLTMSLRME